MQNPRLASRYAKSLLDIAIEQNNLEQVLADMKMIHQVNETSPDFVLLLKSPVVKGDKKLSIINTIFEGKLQVVTLSFIELMIKKGREFYLPEIAATFLNQYKEHKNIRTVNLSTATVLSDEMRTYILNKVAENTEGTVELQTEVNENLIGGFVLKVGDQLFDASIRRDLNDIRTQFTKNLYIADI